MGQLENVQVFIRVVEAGGISRAAEQLDVAKSAVSRRLSELENRLQTKLIQRTTRRFHLTEEGKKYYEKATSVVAAFDELDGCLLDLPDKLTGRLSVSIPLSFGIRHMYKAIDGFRAVYPDIQLNVDLSDREVNMIEEGIDVAFRIGDLNDSSIQARKIIPMRVFMAAAPKYLKQFSENPSIAEVNKMTFLRYSAKPSNLIRLVNPKGDSEAIHPESDIQSNNGDFLLQMAILGHGVVVMPEFICGQAIKNGDLNTILTDYKFDMVEAYAVYPQNRFLSRNARAFIDYLVEFYKKNREWELGGV